MLTTLFSTKYQHVKLTSKLIFLQIKNTINYRVPFKKIQLLLKHSFQNTLIVF